MFVTRSNGSVRGRPMSNNGKVEFDGDNWFFSYRDSAKVAEIEADPTVELAYIATDQGTWISVEGRAEVVEDDARKRDLWQNDLEAWFQGGPEDDDLVLLKVRAERIHAWARGEEVVADRVPESSASSPRRTRGQAHDHLARTSRIAARAGNTHSENGCSDPSPSGTVAPETAHAHGGEGMRRREPRGFWLARLVRSWRQSRSLYRCWRRRVTPARRRRSSRCTSRSRSVVTPSGRDR